MLYKILKGWCIGLFLVVMSAALAPSTYACSCLPHEPPQQALQAADAVFAGRVLHIDHLPDHNVQVALEVEEQWKGNLGSRVELITADNSAACGVNFEKEKRYVVYAGRYEDSLRTGLCDRTAPLESAQEDLEYFGAEHLLTVTPNGRGGICGGSNLAALQALFFIGFGVLWMRRYV